MVWSVALAKAIPRSDAWLHEPKLDGYRFQVVKDGRALRLYSKSGSDWTNSGYAFAVSDGPREPAGMDGRDSLA